MKAKDLGLMGKSLFKSLLGKECLGSLLVNEEILGLMVKSLFRVFAW